MIINKKNIILPVHLKIYYKIRIIAMFLNKFNLYHQENTQLIQLLFYLF